MHHIPATKKNPGQPAGQEASDETHDNEEYDEDVGKDEREHRGIKVGLVIL